MENHNEIIVNNLLIMAFIGLANPAECFGRYCISFNHCTSNEATAEAAVQGFASIAKYNKDWNWLMDVVEKIENLTTIDKEGVSGYENVEQCWRVEIFNDWCKIQYASHLYGWTDLLEERAENKLEATYKAVVEFIKWYNTNK